jgi:hypothetical protein
VPEPAPLYAENAARLQLATVQRLLERESVRFGLVCSATAFVGVRTEAGRRIDASLVVPSALPAGWSDGFLREHAVAGSLLRRAGRTPAARPAAPGNYGPQAHPEPAFERFFEPLPDQQFLEAAGSRINEMLGPGGGALRFHGVPLVEEGAAVLAHGVAGRELTLQPRRLRAVLEDGDPSAVDEAIEVWLCVGRPDAPVVRVGLRELLALGGERPLNLDLSRDERVWIQLRVPGAPWPPARQLFVELA